MLTLRRVAWAVVVAMSSLAVAQDQRGGIDPMCGLEGWFDCDCDDVAESWVCLDDDVCNGGGCTSGALFRQRYCQGDVIGDQYEGGPCPTFTFYAVTDEVIDLKGETVEPPGHDDYFHTFYFYELNYIQEDGDLISCIEGDLIGGIGPGIPGSKGAMLNGAIEWTRAGPNDAELIIREPVAVRVYAVIDNHPCSPSECQAIGWPCCPSPSDMVVHSALSDFDEDGLEYQFECSVCPGEYDPTKFDTDGDGCSDGGEDCDGDGLSNLDELFYGTDPADGDSDGDGVGDLDEINQASDPNDPADHEPAPDCALCDIILTVGDPSGSHSELYEFRLGPFTQNSSGAVGGYGEVVSRAGQIRRSRDIDLVLEGQLEHMGSDQAEADLDGYVRISSNCPICLHHDDYGFRELPESSDYYDPELWQYYFARSNGNGNSPEQRWWECPNGEPRRVEIEILRICRGDIDGDNVVDGSDIGLLLGAWSSDDWCADLNEDGTVNGEDLGVMLSGFSNCMPSCSSRVPYSCRPHEWDDADESMAELGHAATLARCDIGGLCQNLNQASCESAGGTWHFGELCPEAGCQDP